MWIIIALLRFSPQVIVNGFKKCCISSAVGMMTCCEMTVKRLGMSGVKMKMKTLTVKMERVTLIAKGG
jgi:hypothetical protein